MFHLVNTSPGSDTSSLRPSGPYHFNLASDLGNAPILLGTVQLSVGSSDIRFHSSEGLPEADTLLTGKATAGRYSVERFQPEGPLMPSVATSSSLTLTRTTSTANPKGIYEVTAPMTRNGSMMAHVRFRKSDTWQTFAPNWLYPLDGIVAPYFGFRYGQFNFGGFLFLRDDGDTGSVILAGPMQNAGVEREVQEEILFPWMDALNHEPIDLWLFMSFIGFEGHIVPHVPTVEAWGSINDGSPELLGRFVLSAGQQFSYGDTSSDVTLFFGNAGLQGDAVTFLNWELYTDFRLAIDEGTAKAQCLTTFAPDSPILFKTIDGQGGPTTPAANRWFYSSDAGTLPAVETLEFQPGRRASPIKATLHKPVASGHMVYERFSPFLATRVNGFMLEASVDASCTNHSSDSTGVGFEVDDGAYRYRFLFMKKGLGAVLTLAKQYGVDILDEANFYELCEIDYSSLKLFRIVHDRHRKVLDVYINEELQASLTLPTVALLPTKSAGRVRIGHLQDVPTVATCGVGLLGLVSQYIAFEGSDGLLPQNVSYLTATWEKGTGTSTAVPGLTLTKTDKAFVGSKATYLISHPFDDHLGGFLEVHAGVTSYTDQNGTPFVRGISTGVGLDVELGSSVLSLRFIDAGLNGRVVAVLDSRLTLEDFLLQTSEAASRSIRTDWGTPHTYRIHYRPYQAIEIWVDSVVGTPALVIPWNGGFYLPASTNPKGIRFGHFDEGPSSVSTWEFLRFGSSTGYDIGVTQTVADDSIGFGGKASYLLSCGDSV